MKVRELLKERNWDTLYVELEKLLGPSFINYPKTSEWQLRMLQYIKEQKRRKIDE
jgi:hypothetical protein